MQPCFCCSDLSTPIITTTPNRTISLFLHHNRPSRFNLRHATFFSPRHSTSFILVAAPKSQNSSQKAHCQDLTLNSTRADQVTQKCLTTRAHTLPSLSLALPQAKNVSKILCLQSCQNRPYRLTVLIINIPRQKRQRSATYLCSS